MLSRQAAQELVTHTALEAPNKALAEHWLSLWNGDALPPRATDAFHLVGDGVATPVVRFLSDNLLLPLVHHRLERDPEPWAKSA